MPKSDAVGSALLRPQAIPRLRTIERIGDGLKGAVAYGRPNRHRTAHRRSRCQHSAQVTLTQPTTRPPPRERLRLLRTAAKGKSLLLSSQHVAGLVAQA
jgi:hypothetical protein